MTGKYYITAVAALATLLLPVMPFAYGGSVSGMPLEPADGVISVGMDWGILVQGVNFLEDGAAATSSPKRVCDKSVLSRRCARITANSVPSP